MRHKYNRLNVPFAVSLQVACLLFLVGCSEDAELNTGSEQKKAVVRSPEMDQVSELYIPVMLHEQHLKVGDTTWLLDHQSISHVKVHKISEKSSDEKYTADTSFQIVNNGAKVNVRVLITYRVEYGKMKDDRPVWNFVVTDLKLLSMKKVEPVS